MTTETQDTGTATTAAADRAGRASDGAATVLTILDPHDGTLVGELPVAGPERAADAVRRARASWTSWRRVAPAERGAALHAVADAIAAHEEGLARLNHRETGKPLADATGGIRAGIGTLRQYAELAPVHRGHSLNGAIDAVDLDRREPRGVAVVLTPWNDPVAIVCGLVGAAVAMGNTVVHKPSERCPHLGEALGALFAETLPADVVVTLTGDASTGAALADDEGVDVVAHVGSSATGRALALATAVTGAHLIRENGGNDALVVDAGVDPDWAAGQAALGAFANAGQICTSVERIFVHRDVADAFLAALARRADELTAGDSLPPLVDERMRRAVHAHVSAAVEAGARVVAGGEPPERDGSWYPATVLADVPDDADALRQETFGPVAPVRVVDSFDEGLELAARDEYGLAATVLTPSIAHANRAIADLPVGTVKVNAVFGGAPGGAAQPRRASGAGFGYGPELLDEFSAVKVVHVEAAVEAGDNRRDAR